YNRRAVQNVLLLVALLTGGALAAQAVINARLRVSLGSPLWAAAVQTLVGLLLILVVAGLARHTVPLAEQASRVPWWAWIGGLIGATYVVVSLTLVSHLGAALMLSAMIVGQLTAALLIDHY